CRGRIDSDWSIDKTSKNRDNLRLGRLNLFRSQRRLARSTNVEDPDLVIHKRKHRTVSVAMASTELNLTNLNIDIVVFKGQPICEWICRQATFGRFKGIEPPKCAVKRMF
ncbi:MAG: hypothetical protein K8T91_04190, partial [Planctomycetes bacterium]|nr:hypothetical protein [Planctomycetota bacterium]